MPHGVSTHPLYTPPLNFAMVVKDVYRSAYPAEGNIPYLHHIGIETLVLLSIETLPAKVLRALEHDSMHQAAQNAASDSPASPSGPAARFEIPARTERKVPKPANLIPSKPIQVLTIASLESWQSDVLSDAEDFSASEVVRGLDIAVDARWHPVLFACPTGELQTSVLMGCLRRYQNWSFTAIFGECELFLTPMSSVRERVVDFITDWLPDDNPITALDVVARNRKWLKQTDPKLQAPVNFQIKFPTTIDPTSPTTTPSNMCKDAQTLSEQERGNENSPGAHSKTFGLLHATRSQEHSLLGPVHNECQSISSSRKPTSQGLPHLCPAGNPFEHVRFAEWYLQCLHASPVFAKPFPHPQESGTLSEFDGATKTRKKLASPHVRFAGIRNPPSLDPRSTFTKESIVEEDDD